MTKARDMADVIGAFLLEEQIKGMIFAARLLDDIEHKRIKKVSIRWTEDCCEN